MSGWRLQPKVASIRRLITAFSFGLPYRDKSFPFSTFYNIYRQGLDKYTHFGTFCTRTMSTSKLSDHKIKHGEPSLTNGFMADITTTNGDDDLHALQSDRLIWVDLEMTGLDFMSDRILEISCVITEGNLQIVAEGPHIIIHEHDEVLNNMGDWCTEHHGKSGLTAAVRRSEINLGQAERMVLDFVRQHTPKGKCPLAGNTIGMDKIFIERHMPRLAEHLHHRVVDVSTIKELCRRWFPDHFSMAPVKKENHRARDDINESIAELIFYRSTIFK